MFTCHFLEEVDFFVVVVDFFVVEVDFFVVVFVVLA